MAPTDKQMAFIERLVAEGRTRPAGLEQMDRQAVSRAIDTLLQTPPSGAEVSGLVTEPGMYRTPDGEIFKVQKAKQSANLYAKKLVQIGGKRLTEPGDVVHFEFVYEQGAIRTLRADQRLTLDEAKQFGIKYGVCCVCGLTLKDATSVAAGIGPVCVKRL